MAKLGSEKNPLILRLADESNVDNIANICNERGWHFILGIEPDEEEDLTDLERKLNPPIQREATKIGRNKPCSCGSGKKYKGASINSHFPIGTGIFFYFHQSNTTDYYYGK